MSGRDYLNGMPWWVKAIAIVGLPGLISLYLLGAVPWVPNPLQAVSADLRQHVVRDEERTRLLRLVCRGVWRGEPEVQRACDD